MLTAFIVCAILVAVSALGFAFYLADRALGELEKLACDEYFRKDIDKE